MAYVANDEAKVRTLFELLKTNSFDKVAAILPSDQARKNELVKRVNEQSDLWRVRLLSMEFNSNKSKIETAPLGVPLNWFEGFDKRLTLSSPVFGDAVNEHDTLTAESSPLGGTCRIVQRGVCPLRSRLRHQMGSKYRCRREGNARGDGPRDEAQPDPRRQERGFAQEASAGKKRQR